MNTKKGLKKRIKNKKIETKNYVYAFLILVGSILLTLYIFEWYQVKKEERLMNSYLITSNTIESKIESLDSLNQIRQEAPSSYFIYLSYTGDEAVYKLEKNLKRIIDKYKINDLFYYVDLTKLKDESDNYLEIINNKLNIKLTSVPAIIYVNEGKILESNILDNELNGENLENLLNKYEFTTVK